MTTDLTKKDELDLGIDISDMMMIIMMVVMASVLSTVTTTSTQATQALQAQAFVGLTDARELKANRHLQWINLVSDPPYTPWITATFYNDGPHSVFLAINNPDEFTEIGVDGDIFVDMRGGDRRMEFVFYKCNVGETASVRVIGKY
ncbi:hypothetical protein ES703_119583 [subsurface metagenome]